MHDNIIPAQLTARMVRSYIDFDGHKATVSADQPSIQAELQSEGVAGLWGLLQQKGYAYLADEVGMGKTRQAMGVIATQFLSKPDSRIVIVCASAALQDQWQKEWSAFLGNCYRLLDDRLLSADATQLQELRRHNNLREFTAALKDDDCRIHLLRYSSFSRPLSLDKQDAQHMLCDYAKTIGVTGVTHLNEAELAIAAQFGAQAAGWIDKMRHALAEQYCHRLAALLTDGSDAASQPVSPLELVVFDEAQYLRHTDNWQNLHLRHIFRGKVQKWLFLSATPLHSGAGDINSLDAYLEQQPVATLRTAQKDWDVVQLLRQMMIRRTRTYAEHGGKRHGKLQYRRYDRVRYSGADDPFMAMTMALVQKRLVGALAGRGNRFRLGECASFESLSSSVARSIGTIATRLKAADALLPEIEPQKDHKQGEPSGQALDRSVIDELNHSFVQAMHQGSGHGMPHAKLNRMVDDLFDRSIAQGSTHKTLVFVRRIDTVEEIRDLLHVRFQQEIDARIADWRVFLSSPEMAGKPWPADFWQSSGDDGLAPEVELQATLASGDEAQDEGDEPDLPAGAATQNRAFREQPKLAYFEALKQRSETHDINGKLVSFRSRLHSHTDLLHKPLRGFLHRRPAPHGEPVDKDELAWQMNRERWQRLLLAVVGQAWLDKPDNHWLLGDPALDTPQSCRLAALQLCLLQSMRQTDFVVDLYILHTHLPQTPDGATALPDKLLWLFEQDTLPAALAPYIANQRTRLRHWIDNFDLIVDKCFRSGVVDSWEHVWRTRIGEVFRPLAPVIGRSGRVRNKHAIAHFNLPCHPNILVCTDVLKEGVDMHLFCDRVEHYGVAWTSGDLEQRIGRIDRFGSLISRRIGAHAGQDVALPRLQVGFPYLEGTLDQHQVNRVIRAKIASDLRMDLGKRKDEFGEISVEALDDQERAPRHHAGEPAGGAIFFPDSVKYVQHGGGDLALPAGMLRKQDRQEVVAGKPVDADAAESRIPLPAYGAVMVRRQLPTGHGPLRLVADGDAGNERWTEDFVMPRGANANVSPALLLEGGGPHALKHPPSAAFAFDAVRNTCLWRAGTAPVLLEAVGADFWLLRCHVQDDASLDLNGKRNKGNWLARRNLARTAGYLFESDGAVWFGAMVLRSPGAEALLNHMASRVHRIAHNLRQPGNAFDANGYRARTAFPSNVQPIWINTMKQSDVIASGKVLTGVQAWFEEAFEAMVDALYDGISADGRRLQTQPLKFLPNGLLHLSTEGAERFRLQAGLDLAGTLQAPFAGPKMWWELVVTPHKKGKPPELRMSTLDELPHADPASWAGEQRDGYAVYTAEQMDYRYVAVYHAPEDWERARANLLGALPTVRIKLHELGNFTRKNNRDLLLDALA